VLSTGYGRTYLGWSDKLFLRSHAVAKATASQSMTIRSGFPCPLLYRRVPSRSVLSLGCGPKRVIKLLREAMGSLLHVPPPCHFQSCSKIEGRLAGLMSTNVVLPACWCHQRLTQHSIQNIHLPLAVLSHPGLFKAESMDLQQRNP
jgi:hypothetical protein